MIMDKIINRYKKGEFKYSSYKKRYELIKTIIMFALSISIYIMGYVSTGSNKNLLTIVAVLGLLPASKSLVSTIMNFRVHEAGDELREEIDRALNGLSGLYNIYFTSYDKNYFLLHLTVCGDDIIGLCESKDFDEKSFKEHLDKHIKIEKLETGVIKVFDDSKLYIKRLGEINSSDRNKEPDRKLYDLLLNISL